jgi:hypothetical protein
MMVWQLGGFVSFLRAKAATPFELEVGTITAQRLLTVRMGPAIRTPHAPIRASL